MRGHILLMRHSVKHYETKELLEWNIIS
jgi:hypothetical protein